jgi:serine/threonine protein kinase/formylglycine-generating enzyme required for sulfatase activity
MPANLIHPTANELADFAVGKLDDARADAIAAHLGECESCRVAAENAPGDEFAERVRAADRAGPVSMPSFGFSVMDGGSGPRVADDVVPPELANHPRYRIIRKLGQGGMGVVYLAQHKVMDDPRAIKVISQSFVDHPDALARFHREVKAAAKLKHPNIAAAYDAEQFGNLHTLVMEYVEGKSLDRVLEKKGPFPVNFACSYMRQAALGLQHAFEQGMVHRDIKPQNLMLTPKGQIKLLDFGLARLASERRPGKGLTAQGAYMGTPEFMSPEQATDARQADIRADIYSLGCTLFCLLTGRPPFQEDTLVKLALAHINQPPPPLGELRPDVPAKLAAVVAKMLAKNPAERYPTPAEVARALQPFCKVDPRAPVAQPYRAPEPGPAPPALTPMPPRAREEQREGWRPSVFRAASLGRLGGLFGLSRAGNRPVVINVDNEASEPMRDGPPQPWTPSVRQKLIGGAVLAAVFALIVAVALMFVPNDGIVEIIDFPPGAEAFVDQSRVPVKMVDGKKAVIRVKPGTTHQIEVKVDGVLVLSESVTLAAGGREYFGVRTRIPDKPLALLIDHDPKAGAAVGEKGVDLANRYFVIRYRGSGKVVAPSGLAEGSEIEQQTFKPGDKNQHWSVQHLGPNYRFHHRKTGRMLAIPEELGNFRETPFRLMPDRGVRGEYFDLVRKPDGYSIRLPNMMNSLAIAENSASDGMRLVQIGTGNGPGPAFAFEEVIEKAPSAMPSQTSPAVAAEKAQVNAKPKTADQYPTLAGLWQETAGISITITQNAEQFTADCAYHDPQNGDIRWQMKGNVTKEGEITGRLVHSKAPAAWGDQTRVGKLSANGETITGSAKFDRGGGHDFVWRRGRPTALKAPFTPAEARAAQEQWARYLGTKVEETVELGGGERMTFVLIPPGEFVMGASDAEVAEKVAGDHELPRHLVTLSQPMFVSKFTTTRGQFRRFVELTKYITEPERTGGGWGWNAPERKFEGEQKQFSWKQTGFEQDDSHPIVNVTWNDAKEFCKWVGGGPGLPGGAKDVRLLREAEFEYACRAGTTTRYYTGDNAATLARAANVADMALRRLVTRPDNSVADFDDGYAFTAPVGRFQANAFGLYDMLGNVWQLTDDRLQQYPNSAATDPVGTGDKEVVRGGSFGRGPDGCRAANRVSIPLSGRSQEIGFRVALSSLTRGVPSPIARNNDPKPDPVLEALDKAKAAYDADIKTIRKAVLDALDKLEDKAAKDGNMLLVSQIRIQRAAYVDKDECPPAFQRDVDAGTITARGKMQAAFEAAIQAYEKAKDETGAAVARQERDEFRRELWRLVDLGNSVVQDDHVSLAPEGNLATRKEYTGPIEVVVVARTTADNIRLVAYRGSAVIFNWEVNPRELGVHRPDGNEKLYSGSFVKKPFTPLPPNQWHVLRWRILPNGMEIFVNEQRVFVEERRNDLSAKGVISVRSGGAKVDVRLMRVFSIPGVE